MVQKVCPYLFGYAKRKYLRKQFLPTVCWKRKALENARVRSSRCGLWTCCPPGWINGENPVHSKEQECDNNLPTAGWFPSKLNSVQCYSICLCRQKWLCQEFRWKTNIRRQVELVFGAGCPVSCAWMSYDVNWCHICRHPDPQTDLARAVGSPGGRSADPIHMLVHAFFQIRQGLSSASLTCSQRRGQSWQGEASYWIVFTIISITTSVV